MSQTYDASLWTGQNPRRGFPRFEFMLLTPLFGIRIGHIYSYFAYGLQISWGYVPPAPIAARYEHCRSWVWWTAEQLMNRR